MLRPAKIFGFLLLLALVPTTVHGQEPLKPGDVLPGPFHPFNVNGKYGMLYNPDGSIEQSGRHHSLVTEYGLNPVVMIFAREDKTSNDKNLQAFLGELDKTLHTDRTLGNSTVGGFVVFLTPTATGSVFEAEIKPEQRTTKPETLVKQIQERHEMIGRLEKIAKPLQHVIVTYYPERGPKGYAISPKTAIAIIFYDRLKIVSVDTFAANEMTASDVSRIMSRVNKAVLPKPVN